MAVKNSVKKSRFGLLTLVLGVVVLVPVVGAGALFMTFDPDKYRAEIADFLSTKLGRKVTLNGAMHLKLAGGFALEVNDIVLANPDWARRPDMAKIGQMSLAVKIAPLLQSPRRLDVTRITLNDADVQLESNAQGAKNWEFAPVKGNAPAEVSEKVADKPVASGKMPLDISLNELLIKNFRFAQVAGGKTTEVRLKELTLKAKDKTDLSLEGVFNQQAFSVTLMGAAWQDLLAEKSWPFTMQARYAGNDFSGSGTLEQQGKKIELGDFKLVSMIGSTVTGKLAVNLLGSKPAVTGAVVIDAIRAPEAQEATTSEAVPTAPGELVHQKNDDRLFSDTPFDLSPLQSANVDLDVTIKKIVAGKLELADTHTAVKLKDGQLRLPEITTLLAGNKLTGNVAINAAYALSFALRGTQMNLTPLLQAMDMGGITLGKTDVALDYRSQGNSPRALAAHLDGTTLVKIGASQLPTEMMGPVVLNVLKLTTPGSPLAAQSKLTCGIARFNAQDGVMTSNGILLDTSLATVAGSGTIDLRQEQLKLVFQPQPKDATLTSFSAPLSVGGSLAKPAFKLDAASAVVGVVGSFLGKNVPVGKPVMQVPLVNASAADPCLDALEHPTYPTQAAQPTSAAGVAVGKGQAAVQQQVKKLTDKAPPALKNLLGGEQSPLKGLFGQ